MSPGFISHLDLAWTDPNLARFLARLASFARLIIYDKPGTGLSDPIPSLPTLEERVADVEAVLDAADSERAVILGMSEGGPTSILLAASRPERVISLILYGTFAHVPSLEDVVDDDYSPEVMRRVHAAHAGIRSAIDTWGDSDSLSIFAPSVTGELQKRFLATFARAAASPRMARALIDAVVGMDVRDILGAVRVPTLVLHVEGDTAIPVEAGRLLADRIPGARILEFPGIDHAFWVSDPDLMSDDIEQFVTGSVNHAEPDRVLATVLFTDIVGSTEMAARLGDTAWRQVLERHDTLISQCVASYGGRVVKNIGDGALASFDGPARAVRCGAELCTTAPELGVQLRAGVHTGECEAIGDDLGGLAVHIGARVGSLAEAGEVLVSGTVKDLVVGSGMHFADHGEHELKGVPGSWRVYRLGEERRAGPRAEPLDSARDHMRRGDRMTVAMARRAPRMMRMGARLAARSAG
jgi:class 3 adenylate cyclase/pimeloyl-ACP methyl ester carboxylesterase